MGRFWVFGPLVENGEEMWAVSDGYDVPGRRYPKPPGYQEFWPLESEAQAHANALNKECQQ